MQRELSLSNSSLSTKNFEELCLERNLVPLEITTQDVIQTITVRHNVMTGVFDWRADRIGEQAIGLLASAMADMWKYFFRSPLRPGMTSGHAKVIIDLDGDSLKVLYGMSDPNNPGELIPDATVAKAMMASALFGLCEKTSGENFDPFESLTGIKVTQEGK